MSAPTACWLRPRARFCSRKIQIPSSATAVAVGADGRVSVTAAGSTTPMEVGRLTMVRFANAGALTALGNNLYAAATRRGEAIAGHGGEDGMGTVTQGYLEGSTSRWSTRWST